MLKDSSSFVRRAAVDVIVKLGSKEDLPQIREKLKDSSSFVRRAAVDVFIKLGSKEDLKSVLISLISQACKDPNILKY